MALNLAALDEELAALEKRSQMIQDIKRLAANPEAKELLEKLAMNGSVTSHRSELLVDVSYSTLSQVDAVRHAISRSKGRFTVGQIGDELRSHGIGITNVAVGRVLLRLSKRNEIRIAVPGGGNVANAYEITVNFKAV